VYSCILPNNVIPSDRKYRLKAPFLVTALNNLINKWNIKWCDRKKVTPYSLFSHHYDGLSHTIQNLEALSCARFSVLSFLKSSLNFHFFYIYTLYYTLLVCSLAYKANPVH